VGLHTTELQTVLFLFLKGDPETSQFETFRARFKKQESVLAIHFALRG
jgi:hypothetical protein